MSISEHYQHFCTVISNGPATPLLDTLALVHDLSGGKANPEKTKVYWDQWQTLKAAMKANHPMVKLANALAPADQVVPPAFPLPVIVDENIPPGVIIAVNLDQNADGCMVCGKPVSDECDHVDCCDDCNAREEIANLRREVIELRKRPVC